MAGRARSKGDVSPADAGAAVAWALLPIANVTTNGLIPADGCPRRCIPRPIGVR